MRLYEAWDTKNHIVFMEANLGNAHKRAIYLLGSKCSLRQLRGEFKALMDVFTEKGNVQDTGRKVS